MYKMRILPFESLFGSFEGVVVY